MKKYFGDEQPCVTEKNACPICGKPRGATAGQYEFVHGPCAEKMAKTEQKKHDHRRNQYAKGHVPYFAFDK